MSCKHYGIERRYHTLEGAAELLLDGVLWNVQKIHAGRPGSLLPITNELLWHGFELHEQGIVRIVCRKASDLCHDFRGKSERAKVNVIFRWVTRQSLEYRMGTHETQRSPVESAAENRIVIQNLLLTWIRPQYFSLATQR